VQHGSFVALYQHKLSTNDIDGEVGPSTPRESCSEERDMDIELIHVNPIDVEVAAGLVMGLWRPVENRNSCRRIPMNQLSLVCRRPDSEPTLLVT
jgi:hypothetical protein